MNIEFTNEELNLLIGALYGYVSDYDVGNDSCKEERILIKRLEKLRGDKDVLS